MPYAMSDTLLRAKGIHKSYKMGPASVRVLRGASMTVARGEFLVITGASGSGKSTLLHILGGLDVPDKGSVEFNGRDLFSLPASDRQTYRNRDVGFVFQFYHLLPELNVLENVLIPQMVGHSFWSWRKIRGRAKADAREMLDAVGLSHRAKHRPNELSGGERQRVAVARALINRPALLLADEPTGNLDEAIGAEVLGLLRRLNEDGQTIVMVTHNTGVASRAHRSVLLTEGAIRRVDRTRATESPGSVATKEVIR